MALPYALDGMVPIWHVPVMPAAAAYRHGSDHLRNCPRCAFTVSEALEDAELCGTGRLLNARLKAAYRSTAAAARWN
jgi:hypothetical protein